MTAWIQDDSQRRNRLLKLVKGTMVNLVKQYSPHACGFACLAMILGRDVPYVARCVGRDPERFIPEFNLHGGLTGMEMCRVLWEHRVPHLYYASPGMHAEPNPDCGFHHSPWRWALRDQMHYPELDLVKQHVDAGGSAILGLPGDEGGHWLVMAEGQLLDPAPSPKFEAIGQIEVDEAILIRE